MPPGAYGRIALDDRVDRTRRIVRGLAIPIAGATVPADPELLPNAPREFRGGWHEGIDFPADTGTEVHAVDAGTIVRIDHEFVDWSSEQKDAALEEAVQLGYTPSATLDRIRGRQVWIDHGGGIVSRYAHLSAVADLSVTPLSWRLADSLVSYAKYLLLTFWPQRLSIFYPSAHEMAPAWEWGGALVLLGAITVVALRNARKRPYLAEGWLWFLGTLVPVIG